MLVGAFQIEVRQPVLGPVLAGPPALQLSHAEHVERNSPVLARRAARVDGATDSQVFWRITLPQIGTTIGVVVTTLIVLVMKVYDIVKVMTNGNFGTQVLANDMFQQAFQFNNTGRGASLAVLILVSVLPVMVFNIRRMQKEL